jgi:hypothetical protein
MGPFFKDGDNGLRFIPLEHAVGIGRRFRDPLNNVPVLVCTI